MYTNEKIFYGYKHWTLETSPRCFYVGKGVEGRSHCTNHSRNHKWHAIVKRLGLRVKICVGPWAEDDTFVWEKENIISEGTYSENHDHHNNNDIGCNFTYGGEGVAGYKHTLEQRKAKSERQTGKQTAKRGQKSSEQTRKNQSIAITAMYANHPEIKEKISQKLIITNALPEVKERRSKASKKTASNEEFRIKKNNAVRKTHADPLVRAKYSGKNNGNARPVTQATKQGEIIAYYDTIAEAGRLTQICHISDVLRGVRKYAGGFIWRYTEDD